MADTVSEVLWLERGTALIWLQKKAIYCYYSEFFFLRFSILPAKESAHLLNVNFFFQESKQL